MHAMPCVILRRTTTTTMPNTIKLRSSDDETFEVDEDVALYVSIDRRRRERRKTTTTHMNEFIHSLLPTDERVCCFTFNRATIAACLKRFDPSLKVRARVDIKYRDGFGKGKQTSS
jgi:hypothetical protein